ncbi:MAG: Arc family DNA-binding protein [Blastocatellia bacterium]|nr:Arc family DNA-binding protein [Blastocatellia bacterium]
MPNILIRDVEIIVLEKLKRRAAGEGRSLQSEMQRILKDAAGRMEQLSELETARRIRASLTKENRSNSVELLREDRRR